MRFNKKLYQFLIGILIGSGCITSRPVKLGMFSSNQNVNNNGHYSSSSRSNQGSQQSNWSHQESNVYNQQPNGNNQSSQSNSNHINPLPQISTNLLNSLNNDLLSPYGLNNLPLNMNLIDPSELLLSTNPNLSSFSNNSTVQPYFVNYKGIWVTLEQLKLLDYNQYVQLLSSPQNQQQEQKPSDESLKMCIEIMLMQQKQIEEMRQKVEELEKEEEEESIQVEGNNNETNSDRDLLNNNVEVPLSEGSGEKNNREEKLNLEEDHLQRNLSLVQDSDDDTSENMDVFSPPLPPIKDEIKEPETTSNQSIRSNHSSTKTVLKGNMQPKVDKPVLTLKRDQWRDFHRKEEELNHSNNTNEVEIETTREDFNRIVEAPINQEHLWSKVVKKDPIQSNQVEESHFTSQNEIQLLNESSSSTLPELSPMPLSNTKRKRNRRSRKRKMQRVPNNTHTNHQVISLPRDNAPKKIQLVKKPKPKPVVVHPVNSDQIQLLTNSQIKGEEGEKELKKKKRKRKRQNRKKKEQEEERKIKEEMRIQQEKERKKREEEKRKKEREKRQNQRKQKEKIKENKKSQLKNNQLNTNKKSKPHNNQVNKRSSKSNNENAKHSEEIIIAQEGNENKSKGLTNTKKTSPKRRQGVVGKPKSNKKNKNRKAPKQLKKSSKNRTNHRKQKPRSSQSIQLKNPTLRKLAFQKMENPGVINKTLKSFDYSSLGREKSITDSLYTMRRLIDEEQVKSDEFRAHLFIILDCLLLVPTRFGMARYVSKIKQVLIECQDPEQLGAIIKQLVPDAKKITDPVKELHLKLIREYAEKNIKNKEELRKGLYEYEFCLRNPEEIDYQDIWVRQITEENLAKHNPDRARSLLCIMVDMSFLGSLTDIHVTLLNFETIVKGMDCSWKNSFLQLITAVTPKTGPQQHHKRYFNKLRNEVVRKFALQKMESPHPVMVHMEEMLMYKEYMSNKDVVLGYLGTLFSFLSTKVEDVEKATLPIFCVIADRLSRKNTDLPDVLGYFYRELEVYKESIPIVKEYLKVLNKVFRNSKKNREYLGLVNESLQSVAKREKIPAPEIIGERMELLKSCHQFSIVYGYRVFCKTLHKAILSCDRVTSAAKFLAICDEILKNGKGSAKGLLLLRSLMENLAYKPNYLAALFLEVIDVINAQSNNTNNQHLNVEDDSYFHSFIKTNKIKKMAQDLSDEVLRDAFEEMGGLFNYQPQPYQACLQLIQCYINANEYDKLRALVYYLSSWGMVDSNRVLSGLFIINNTISKLEKISKKSILKFKEDMNSIRQDLVILSKQLNQRNKS